jgi:replicative DNA helicase
MSISAKKGRNFTPYYRDSKPLTVAEVNEFPCVAVENMDLLIEDAEFYGVRSEFSQEDGETIVATYLPYYNQEGKLTGYKRRDWLRDKEEKGHFTVVGVVKVNSKLFGQQHCNVNKNSKVYYVEGEGDVFATRRALLNSLKGTKYEGKISPNVVGLNCGAGNATHSTAHNEDFLRGFKEIVCIMDNDEATEMERLKGVHKGKEATEAISSYLLAQNFYVVEYPEKIKDPREWFKKDPAGFAKKITWELKKFSPEKLVELSTVNVSDLRKKKKKGIPLRQLKDLQHKTGSPIKSELWSLTAPSGAGKSTIAREIEFDIASYLMYGINDREMFKPDELKLCSDGKYRLTCYEDDEKLGVIRLEEGFDESLNSLYAMDIGVEPKAFVAEPDKFLSEEDHDQLHRKWSDKGKVIVLDHFGSLQIDSLISKLKQMMAYGCKWFILDHYTMLVSGLRTGNDVKELDIIMTELAAFCSQYGVFILGISHMKRKNIDPPKNKEGETLPFFYPVRKEDMRGSAALEQLSWVVIGIEPEELPNRSRGRVRLVVMKNRRGKVLGNSDVLWQNEDGTYTDASKWEVDNGSYLQDGDIVVTFDEPVVPCAPPRIKPLEKPVNMVDNEPTPKDEPF